MAWFIIGFLVSRSIRSMTRTEAVTVPVKAQVDDLDLSEAYDPILDG